jgi:2-dehydro-3-deoxygalactonokinase
MLASIVAAPAVAGAAFTSGTRAGADRALGLGTQLFGVRAKVIRKDLTREDAASYLRGLLIGAEIADARMLYPMDDGQVVTLVGAAPVCALYAEALAGLNLRAVVVDAGDASAQGFAAIHSANGGASA